MALSAWGQSSAAAWPLASRSANETRGTRTVVALGATATATRPSHAASSDEKAELHARSSSTCASALARSAPSALSACAPTFEQRFAAEALTRLSA